MAVYLVIVTCFCLFVCLSIIDYKSNFAGTGAAGLYKSCLFFCFVTCFCLFDELVIKKAKLQALLQLDFASLACVLACFFVCFVLLLALFFFYFFL